MLEGTALSALKLAQAFFTANRDALPDSQKCTRPRTAPNEATLLRPTREARQHGDGMPEADTEAATPKPRKTVPTAEGVATKQEGLSSEGMNSWRR